MDYSALVIQVLVRCQMPTGWKRKASSDTHYYILPLTQNPKVSYYPCNLCLALVYPSTCTPEKSIAYPVSH